MSLLDCHVLDVGTTFCLYILEYGGQLLLCETNDRGHRRRHAVAMEWYEGHNPVTVICSLLQSTVRSLEEG